MDSARFKFALPATLVVTTFLCASGCKEQSSDEGSDNADNSDETYGPIPDYCIDIENMTVCESEPGCAWDPQNGYCQNVCFMIMDEAECVAIEKCEWYTGSESETGGSETGEGGYCDEPFT
jgi:hypothetical protein